MPDTAPPLVPPSESLPGVVASPAEFPRLDPTAAPGGGTPLDSLRDVPITITVRLGHAILPIAEILKLGPGAVVELEETVGAPVELTVKGVPFATGEVVVVDDHFAVRIKTLLPPRGARGET